MAKGEAKICERYKIYLPEIYRFLRQRGIILRCRTSSLPQSTLPSSLIEFCDYYLIVYLSDISLVYLLSLILILRRVFVCFTLLFAF